MHLSQPLLIVFAGTFVPYLDGWLNLFVPNVLRSLPLSLLVVNQKSDRVRVAPCG